ncbi:MAG: hypothetical protein ISS92_05505 [Candidatus Omnitrophica bacterium]|nr:hypothetical protein [Candidatus Omnitrophota bacterium]
MRLDILDDLWKNKIKFAYAVSFFIIGFFAYMLLVRHDIGKFYTLRHALTETRKNLYIVKTIVEYKDYVDKFNRDFTINISENKLVDRVREIADKNSTKLEMVRPFESQFMSGYKNLRVIVQGEAPYRNLAYFIKELEGGEDYFIVEELKLTAREPSPGSERVAAFKLIVTCFSLEK